MPQQIQAEMAEGGAAIIQYDNPPDECPICHTAVLPRLVAAALSGTLAGTTDGGRLQVVCRCTKRICDSLFIAIYSQKVDEKERPHGFYYFDHSVPTHPRQEPFSDLIKSASSSFVEIFDQAVAADALQLTEVSGMGFRKSLEFLIKDFAIHKNQNAAEVIKAIDLGTCINNYVDDARVKMCAERAAWLGNDESHYMRKWKDKDVNDLKVLIKLSVNWIENVLLTEGYSKEMIKPPPKKRIKQ